MRKKIVNTRIHIYRSIFLKHGHNVCLIDISAFFENGSGSLKKMAARGGIFAHMAIVKPFLHSRSHIYTSIFMKLGPNICCYDTSAELENCFGPLKNMATRERGSLPCMAIAKPC